MLRLLGNKTITWFIMGCIPVLAAGCGQRGLVPEEDALRLEISSAELTSQLETAIPELMQKAGIPGLQIALIREGRVLWDRGFGIKNTQTGDPVDEHTVFEAASLTKPFFAYLIMKMVEAGEIDLDTPLVEYAPREIIEKQYIRHSMDLEGFREDWFRRITARQVLSHSSGLPHGGPRRPLPVLFEPGSRYRYSADGYMYLQRIVEHLSAKPLHAIMQEEVIDPLGMEDSCMVWQERYAEQAAVGHDTFSETSGLHRRRRLAHSAASLYTTAHDYARFVAALMKETGLEHDTVDLMLSPQIEVAEGVFWSLGFGLEDNSAGRAYWQWGDYGIFRNYITAFKDQGIGVVYLTNSFNGLSIGPELVRLAIGGGESPALNHLGYPRYDSPAVKLGRVAGEQGLAEAQKLYLQIRRESPGDLAEQDVNNIGYNLLRAKKFPEAIAVFLWNVEAYPLSANACDSLAEAYMESGDTENAIKFYEKVLEMIPDDPRPDRDALEDLAKGARDRLTRLRRRPTGGRPPRGHPTINPIHHLGSGVSLWGTSPKP